ncbi:MAG: hypothetical protein WB763_10810 [Terriglobia bacterium]|jgi:hypothetical protein
MAEGEAIRLAIKELQGKLEKQERDVSQTKSAINVLLATLGEVPLFEQTENKTSAQGNVTIRADQYFKKGITAAAKEYLKAKGSAAKVEEIIDALTKGGCELGANALKNVKISLSKNSRIFAQINEDTFGLWEMYGGRPREKKAEPEGAGEQPELGSPEDAETQKVVETEEPGK